MDQSGGYTDPFIADLYDYVIPYSNRRDIAFFVEMARNSAGPVLEVGCGTGRVLLPTARAGIEIVGLDSSPVMLSVCRNRLSTEPESVQAKVAGLVEGDMRDFELGRQFSLVTIPFRPFQHLLTVEDQMSCLTSIRRHLIEGGRLILDIFNPSLPSLTDERSLSEHGEEPEFTTAGGLKVVRSSRIVSRDYFTQVTDNELIYNITHTDGHRERLVHRFSMRYLFRFEAEHLLVRCGFSVQEVYADYDKSPFGSTYPGELILVAQKS